MNSLEGKVALVTGAASKRGMGRAIALRLAREGADVVIVDKIAAPKSLWPGDEGWGGLDTEVAEIKALGREAIAMVADISNSKDIDKIVAKTLEKFGKIDILVNCAAIRGSVTTPLIDLDEKDWRIMMDINLTGSFLLAKAAGKHMVARGEGGKIVLFASMAGLHGVPGSGSYSVSKWGVIGLVKNLALELGPHKISVNGINPGAIVTNLRDESFAEMAKSEGTTWDEARKKDHQMVGKTIPWGRLGTVEEIADVTYFLVSDLSTYVTGETIGVGGGRT
jgi:3-oxoacyl-[acyl-carrier protein] reductase